MKLTQMDPVTLAAVTTLEIVQNECHLNTLGCSACTSFNNLITSIIKIKTNTSRNTFFLFMKCNIFLCVLRS
jgi:hypothetical protein